jgi:hypothetical protein
MLRVVTEGSISVTTRKKRVRALGQGSSFVAVFAFFVVFISEVK